MCTANRYSLGEFSMYYFLTKCKLNCVFIHSDIIPYLRYDVKLDIEKKGKEEPH